MSTFKVEAPNIGDYVCIYFKVGGWVQIKIETEGVVVDAFDSDDELMDTMALWNENLGPVNEEAEHLAELERGYAKDREEA